jgi:hypothetical protein
MRLPCASFASLAVLLGVSSLVVAQPEPQPKGGRLTISVTLSAADYLRPASRASLLPRYDEAIPGNRVQMFLRCFMEQDHFFGKTETENRDLWNQLPLAQLPLDKLRNYGGALLSGYMYDAARMTQADWQLWYFLRRDGYYTLLPDAQKMRALANAMKTRVRGEIALGDFDGALHTQKCMFALSRTFEEHPTLIGHLVGTALGAVTANTVEEMIQQPGCPNLFWALTDLPSPFLSLRLSIQGERVAIGAEYESLRNAASAIDDSAILKRIERIEDLLKVEAKENKLGSGQAGGWKAHLLARAKNTDDIDAARKRIVEAGIRPEHVIAWSPLHVAFIDELLVCEKYFDEMAKWFNLPYWLAKPGLDAVDAEIKKAVVQAPPLELIPASAKVKMAQVRLNQTIAYLQILEALRLHAFNHDGALPPTLADTKLPLPVDPVTGKPFEYSVTDGVATLHGANSLPGAEALNRYYEIRIKK